MKSRIPLGALAYLCFAFLANGEVPATIRLADGRTLEGVKAAHLENGQLKVAHAAGVSRHDLASVDPAALRALGLEVDGKAAFPAAAARKLEIPAVPLLWSAKGKLYKNARAFTLENPSEISFTCDAGPVTKLRIDSLEPEARGQFGYEPAKAKEYDARVETERNACEMAKKSDEEKARIDNELAKEEANKLKVLNAITCLHFGYISAKILQVLPEGCLLTDVKMWKGREEWMENPSTDMVDHLAIFEKMGNCVVFCDTSGLVDGQSYHAIVSESGTFAYINTLGSRSTVSAFESDSKAGCKKWGASYEIPPHEIAARIIEIYDPKRLSYHTPMRRFKESEGVPVSPPR